MIEHAYPHRSPHSRYVTTPRSRFSTRLQLFVRPRAPEAPLAIMMQPARTSSVGIFAPRPVSSHKGLPTDDVVPCLLRPICSSAISVAAIARGAFSPSVSPCLSLLLRVYVFQRARILAMADGVHACVCVCTYIRLYWAGSTLAPQELITTNPGLLAERVQCFRSCAQWCTVRFTAATLLRLVSPPSRPISCRIPPPRHLPRPLLYPSPSESQWRYLRRDCPPHLLSHGICLQCEIRLRGEKKISAFWSRDKRSG